MKYVFILLGAFALNYLADQATLRNCATDGRVELFGGGTITCKVVSGE